MTDHVPETAPDPSRPAGASSPPAAPLTLADAAGHRLGIVAPPVPVAPTPADVPGVHSWSVPAGPSAPMRSLGGGVGWSVAAARDAAVGEALERYAAAYCALPRVDAADLAPDVEAYAVSDLTHLSVAQRAAPGFPHRASWDDPARVEAVDLVRGTPAWLPWSVVTLDPDQTTLATSNGLAAGPTLAHATLRGLQELVERDAFMVLWLHQVAPAGVPLGRARREPVEVRGGWVRAFDATPRWSPHPVAVVVGALPLEGRERRSLGMACRSTWDEAVDKAYLEWCQGTTFVGHRWSSAAARAVTGPSAVRDFDAHALFHSLRPTTWPGLAFLAGDVLVDPPPSAPTGPPEHELDHLAGALADHGVRSFAVDLTTADLHQVGVRAVRCTSPQLTPIHGDHRWPHLGGTTADLARRFPGARPRGPFPSPHPHPLG